MKQLPRLPSLSRIFTDDAEIQRRGRLLQRLILALTGIELLRLVISLVEATLYAVMALSPVALGLQAIALPLLALVALSIVRHGRPQPAAHLFFTGFNLILLGLIILTGSFGVYPYLMLIAVIAVGIVTNVGASILYTAVVLISVTLTAIFIAPEQISQIVPFYLLTLSLSISAWLIADYLHNTLQTATSATQQMQAQTSLIQRRARQLQLSTEVSQITSAALESGELMHDAALLIRDQFDFYHVSIFSLSPDNETLLLTEATGPIGSTLKKRGYHLPLDTHSIIGWVATHKKARIVSDVHSDPLFYDEPELPETRAEMALPLLSRGQLLGVLDVQSRNANAFREEDITILQLMANQVAINFDNARLFAETERRLQESELLFSFIRLLTTTLDPGEIYRRSARALSRELPADVCVLSSWQAADSTITTQSQYTSQVTDVQVSKIRILADVHPIDNFQAVSETITSGAPKIENIQAGYKLLPPAVPWQTAVCLHVPLVRGDTVTGVAHLFRATASAPFTTDDIRLAQTLANQTAVALENAHLTAEARARVAQLSTLNRMSAILSLAPSLNDIFNGARQEILPLIEATGMSIMLLTPEKDRLNWIYGYEYGQEVDLTSVPPLPVAQGFSGYVVRTKETLLISGEMDSLSDELQSFVVGAPASSWLGIPMIVANELIGVLAVENEHDPNAFSQRDVELLRTITGPLAIAIHNLLQLERVQAARDAQARQRLQIQTAAEVAATATSTLDLEKLIQQSVDLIRERFELYYVGLFLTEPDTAVAHLRAATGQAGEIQIDAGHRLDVGGRSLIGGATGDGQPRIIQDVTTTEEWRPNPHLPDTRSELALPLRVRGQIIGALTVQSVQAHTFSSELVGTLQTMCDQLAIAIDNVRLLAAAEAQARSQQQLNQISTQMHRSADIQQIITIGLRAVNERLHGAPVSLRLGKTPTTTDDTDKRGTP